MPKIISRAEASKGAQFDLYDLIKVIILVILKYV